MHLILHASNLITTCWFCSDVKRSMHHIKSILCQFTKIVNDYTIATDGNTLNSVKTLISFFDVRFKDVKPILWKTSDVKNSVVGLITPQRFRFRRKPRAIESNGNGARSRSRRGLLRLNCVSNSRKRVGFSAVKISASMTSDGNYVINQTVSGWSFAQRSVHTLRMWNRYCSTVRMEIKKSNKNTWTKRISTRTTRDARFKTSEKIRRQFFRPETINKIHGIFRE